MRMKALLFEKDESGKFREEDVPAALRAEAAKKETSLLR